MEEKFPAQLLLPAINAAILAGEEILSIYESDFSVQSKADSSPLTLADQNAHNVIADRLSETGIPLLSEEGKDISYELRKGWEHFWMIDPLDGTKEFIKRNGEFTVNIALIHHQKAILGVVYIPVTRVLYFAAEGLGAYKLRIDGVLLPDLQGIISNSQRLPVSMPSRRFTVVASRSHLSEETEMFVDGLRKNHPDLEFISSGSSVKLCLVAEGSADIYPRFAPTMEWDTAAGQAICEMAGMKVTDYNTNQSLLYNKEDLLNSWFIVSAR